MSKPTISGAMQRLRNFENAACDYAFSGSADKDERPHIEAEFLRQKEKMRKYFKMLIKNQKDIKS